MGAESSIDTHRQAIRAGSSTVKVARATQGASREVVTFSGKAGTKVLPPSMLYSQAAGRGSIWAPLKVASSAVLAARSTLAGAAAKPQRVPARAAMKAAAMRTQ